MTIKIPIYATDPKAQFASPYLYAGNNPINMVDPKGELSFLAVLAIGALIGAVIGGGVAAYTGVKAGLKGWDLVGYIAAGAGIGAVAGAVSAAGGVAAFAAGAAAVTAGGSTAAAFLAGAGVGAVVGAGVGASQAAAQFGVNNAFGVKNQGSLWDTVWKGALIGGIGGAITGGIAGFGGARSAAMSLAGGANWGHPLKNAQSLDNAYDAFTSFGSRPESLFSHPGRWFTALPTKVNTLSTQGTIIASGVQKGIEQVLPASTETSSVNLATNYTASAASYQRPDASLLYGKLAFNPSMSNSVGLPFAVITQPAYWGGSPIGNPWRR